MLTTEELFREYIKLFTLIVETAGQRKVIRVTRKLLEFLKKMNI